MLELTHPTFTLYRVREDGQITGPRSVLKPGIGNHGYLQVIVHLDGKKFSRRVHTLVCEAFHGAKPFPEAQVRHRDSNPFNNHFTNLCWGTAAEQSDDRVINGTTALSRTDATWLRELFATRKWTQADLAARFQVDRVTVQEVLQNKLWHDAAYAPLSNLGGEHRRGDDNPAAELTWPLVREIRAKFAAGKYRHEDLAAEYGVVKATITYLLANQTWVDPDYIPLGGKPRVKMTVARAEEIRQKFAGHKGTRTVFAQQEGISAPLLSDILNGKKYMPAK
jgi:plasmid maintenance system antidote protein VapI